MVWEALEKVGPQPHASHLKVVLLSHMMEIVFINIFQGCHCSPSCEWEGVMNEEVIRDVAYKVIQGCEVSS